jgi:hypothetical protein
MTVEEMIEENEDVADEIMLEKIVRELTRCKAELLSQIFSNAGEDRKDLTVFKYPDLVKYLITGKVLYYVSRY